MATLLLKKRLLNPGRKRRRKNLSPKQIKFFGTKAQRSALKRRRSNKGTSKRRKNIGEIITLDLRPRMNNGKRKRRINSMARRRIVRRANPVRRRRRRNAPKSWSALYRKAYHRKRNSGRVRRRRRANTGVARVIRRRRRNTGARVVYRRRRNTGVVRRRRRNRGYSVRRRRNTGYRRRNPNFGGIASKVFGASLGWIGTSYVTGMVANFSPTLGTGVMSYATGAAVAFGLGFVVDKVLKRPALAEDIVVGGVLSVVAKIASQYMPSLGLSGFRGRGMGFLGGSSFTYPSILAGPGNFAQFQVAPDYQTAINSAVASANAGRHGMGAIFPQSNGGGRNNLRRVGRAS